MKGKRTGGSRNTPLSGNTQNPKSPSGQSNVLTPTKNMGSLKGGPLHSNGMLTSPNDFNGMRPTNFLLNTNKDVGSLLPSAASFIQTGGGHSSSGSMDSSGG